MYVYARKTGFQICFVYCLLVCAWFSDFAWLFTGFTWFIVDCGYCILWFYLKFWKMINSTKTYVPVRWMVEQILRRTWWYVITSRKLTQSKGLCVAFQNHAKTQVSLPKGMKNLRSSHVDMQKPKGQSWCSTSKCVKTLRNSATP